MSVLDRERQEHESFGMAGFYRTTSSNAHALFGSSIKHRDTIVLRIKKGYVERDLNRDWYYGDKELIEIELSKSQFADLVSTMNTGDGVPVTIRYIDGQKMEDCPFVDKASLHMEEFRKSNESAINKLKAVTTYIKNLFNSKQRLTKEEKNNCVEALEYVYRELKPNSEYQIKCFQEQMENTVTEAKGEIEAFFENKMLSVAQMNFVENKEELEKIGESHNPVEM